MVEVFPLGILLRCVSLWTQVESLQTSLDSCLSLLFTLFLFAASVLLELLLSGLGFLSGHLRPFILDFLLLLFLASLDIICVTIVDLDLVKESKCSLSVATD